MSRRFDSPERFDEELRRATRALVSEPLPEGVLTPTLGVRAGRTVPGLATALAASIVLLVTLAIAFGPISPGGPRQTASPAPTVTAGPAVSPAATPTPSSSLPVVFRTTAAIRTDLGSLGYSCRDGAPLSSIPPGPDAAVRESAVCLAPADIGPFQAAVIVSESATGAVVEVHAKADFTDADTGAARTAVAFALAKAAAVAAGVPGAGNEIGDWVNETVPTLEVSGGANTELRGFDVKVLRNANGGYLLILHRAATG